MALPRTELPTLSAASLNVLLDETFNQLADDMRNGTGNFDESPLAPDRVIDSHMTMADMSTVVTRRGGQDVDVAPENQAALVAMKKSIANADRSIARISLGQTFQTPFDQLGRSNDDLINGMLELSRLVERESFATLRTVAQKHGWLMNFDKRHWLQEQGLSVGRTWSILINLTFVRNALNFGQEFVVGGGGDVSAALFPNLKRVPVES